MQIWYRIRSFDLRCWFYHLGESHMMSLTATKIARELDVYGEQLLFKRSNRESVVVLLCWTCDENAR